MDVLIVDHSFESIYYVLFVIILFEYLLLYFMPKKHYIILGLYLTKIMKFKNHLNKYRIYDIKIMFI